MIRSPALRWTLNVVTLLLALVMILSLSPVLARPIGYGFWLFGVRIFLR